MGVDLSELLALPLQERTRLAEALVESVARAELEPIVQEFVARADRTNKKLAATISRLEHLDEDLEIRIRAEVREEVLTSGAAWPFAVSRRQ